MIKKYRQSNVAVIIASVAAAALIVAVGLFLLVRPQQSDAQALNAKVADLQTQISARKAQLSQPSANVKVRASDLYRLTKALPDTPDVTGVLLQLDRLARNSGLSLRAVNPSAAVPGTTGVNELPFTVQLQGRFGSLSRFVGALQRLTRVHKGLLDSKGRLYLVKGITVGQGDQPFPIVSGQLTLSTYVFTGGAASTGTPGADGGATTTEQPTTQSAAPATTAAAAGANP